MKRAGTPDVTRLHIVFNAIAGGVFAAAALLGSQGSHADEASDLARQLSNPIANLTSLPFQFNYDRGFGPKDDGYRVTTNIQPVVPFPLNEDWTLISRTILPVVYQDDVFPGPGTQFGLGDTVQSLFLSPRPVPIGKGSVFIFGAGPVFLLPTGTDRLLSAEKWGAGPTAVGLVQSGPWTYGALSNHIWSFAGDEKRADVNATFIQPFVSYTTPGAWTFTLQSESSYNWETDDWAIPVNFVVSKLVTINRQPVSISAGLKYNVDPATGGQEGLGARLNFTFLFPK